MKQQDQISTKITIKLILFCSLIHLPAISQDYIKGKIIEKDTKLPLAFASIIYQTKTSQKGTISDIYGCFRITEPDVKSIIVSCVGYKQNKTVINPETNTSNLIITMQKDTIVIHELIVTPANNPAIRIIKNVLKNKEKNNFERYDKFRYRCYFKTILDIKTADKETVLDSAETKELKLFNKQAFFISEALVLCTKVSNQRENKIVATKTSGFHDPLFNQSFFSIFHNSISFYNNSISLFKIPLSNDKSITDYVSPLSDGCLNSYRFELEDSYEMASDSIYVINFFPKRGKNFNSLKGKLLVSSNGFAIKNIIAEPVEKGLIDFKFRQDYEYINNKWFPSKLDEEISFVSMQLDKKIKVFPVYLVTSKIDSVDHNPAISKASINLEKVYIDKFSITKSDSIIKTVRTDTLTKREMKTYQIIDSIGKKYNLDRVAKVFTKLAVGRVPITIVDIDLTKVYNYNKYEGTRLGIGMYTNERLCNFFSIGGFFGHGFKDKKNKYGGEIAFDINQYHEVQLKLAYQDNLNEVGSGLIHNQSNLVLSDYLRRYIGYRFDNFIEHKIEFSFRSFRFLKIGYALSIKELKPMYGYAYKGTPLTNYQSDDIQITARYAYGEEMATIGAHRNVNVEGNPIINVAYKRGIHLFNKQSYTYNRIETTLDISAYKGRIGQSNIRLACGLVDKSLPYGLLFTGEGSKNSSIPMLIDNSFQTMLPYEFLSDRYVHLFYSHNFGTLLFKTPKFKPQFVIVQNSGWGTLKNEAFQGIEFKLKNKVYLESGLIINNIIKINYLDMFYLGFGAGTFYRYGFYSFVKKRDNFAVKLALSVSLK